MPSWFAAVLLVRSRAELGWDDDPIVDCQVRLIRANTAEMAYEQALALGRAEEHSYRNDRGETVRWEFLGLHDLVEIGGEPGDGVEVYSWLAALGGAPAVVAKEELTVFWKEANAEKRVSDLLD